MPMHRLVHWLMSNQMSVNSRLGCYVYMAKPCSMRVQVEAVKQPPCITHTASGNPIAHQQSSGSDRVTRWRWHPPDCSHGLTDSQSATWLANPEQPVCVYVLPVHWAQSKCQSPDAELHNTRPQGTWLGTVSGTHPQGWPKLMGGSGNVKCLRAIAEVDESGSGANKTLA